MLQMQPNLKTLRTIFGHLKEVHGADMNPVSMQYVTALIMHFLVRRTQSIQSDAEEIQSDRTNLTT